MESRITLWLENNERSKIEARIKQEYPKIKSISELVRAAIEAYLATAAEAQVKNKFFDAE